MLNKNMAVGMIQVGTKFGKFNFIENKRKIDFLDPSRFFDFSNGKRSQKGS
jgi:hypothetical protein